jgi:DNA polymerase III subunit beta
MMVFVLPKEELLQALGLVLPSIRRKSSNYELANVLLEGERSALWITGTDIDTTVTTSLDADCGTFRCGVPAHKLYDIVKLAQGDEIRLTLEAGRLKVQFGRARHQLPTTDGSGFPELAKVQGDVVSFPGFRFHNMVDAVAPAMDMQEGSRWAIGGIAIEIKGGAIYFVATDQSQMAVAAAKLSTEAELSTIIPRESVAALKRFAQAASGDVEMVVDANHTCLRAEHGLAIARRLAGEYPNWRSLLPKDAAHEVLIGVDDLAHAIRSVSLATENREGLPPRAMRFRFVNDSLTLTAKNIDASSEGEETISIECETLKNSDVTIGVAGGQISEFLGLVDKKEQVKCLIPADTNKQPLMFEPVKSVGFNLKFITMAVRLSW